MVGDAVLDLALEVATGDVHRAGDRALLVLVGLADVEHHGAGSIATAVVRRGGVDLADLGLGLREQIAEASHRVENPTR